MLSSDHEQISDLLNAYLDGEVTPAERARVRRHLATCDLCQAELDSLRLTRQALQALPMLRAPRPFTLAQEAVLDAEGAGDAGERQHGGTVVPFPGSPRSRLPATAGVPASDAPPRAPRWPTRLGLIWRVSSVAAAACALLFALQIASMSPVRPAPAPLLRDEVESRQASGLDAAAAPRTRQAAEPAAAAPAPVTSPEGAGYRSDAAQAAGARVEATAVPGAAAARERALQPAAATGAAASAPPRAPGGAEAVDSAAKAAQADLAQGQESGAKGQASAAGAGRTETEAPQSRRGGDGAATASRAQASGGDGRAAAVTLGLASLFGLAALAAFTAERVRGKGS